MEEGLWERRRKFAKSFNLVTIWFIPITGPSPGFLLLAQHSFGEPFFGGDSGASKEKKKSV